MASARPTINDRRNVGARVRHPRRSPRARRKKPCSANICAQRTLRSRRATGTSGRHARRQCLPLLWLSQLPSLWISSTFALLTFSQPLHVSKGPPDQFLNTFVIGLWRFRKSFEKEAPLLHDLDPCPCRLRTHLVFEVFVLRLIPTDCGRMITGLPSSAFGLQFFRRGPSPVEVDRFAGHAAKPESPARRALDGCGSEIPPGGVIHRYPGARCR